MKVFGFVLLNDFYHYAYYDGDNYRFVRTLKQIEL